MKLIQINLNHYKVAKDLLSQTVLEMEVAIICEQYSDLASNWVSDSSKKAAIWSCGTYAIEECSTLPDVGFVRGKINGIHIYSCYAAPSLSLQEFELFLDRLTSDAKKYSPLIIAGDFNAWSTAWGSSKTNARGHSLLEAFSNLKVVLLNDGSNPTFTKAGKE